MREFGAGDEARTRYLHLGKVALYRMSYTRNQRVYYNINSTFVKMIFFNSWIGDFRLLGYSLNFRQNRSNFPVRRAQRSAKPKKPQASRA